MADDETTPTSPADPFGQFGAMTARLWGLPGPMESMQHAPGLPSIPQIGSLSAAQFKAMTSSVLAQRRSIEALQAQLQAFDEHLAALQKILEPLLEWSTSWAALEKQSGLHPGAPDSQ